MPIYTKNGDQGFTSTLSGERKRKSENVINALGEIDELNSILGLLLAELKEINSKPEIRNRIQTQQSNLMKLGTMVAVGSIEELKDKFPILVNDDVKQMEEMIDIWTSELPELQNFILPGGNIPSAYTHHARSVCRRTERSIVALNLEVAQNELILKYINRLSDWLFTLARVLNEGKDIVWSN